MNLNYEPTIAELRRLIDSAQKSLTAHNVVVDFDGEVIVDPELKYPGVDLDKFKFRTRISNLAKLNERMLKALYSELTSVLGKRAQLNVKFNRLAA